MSIVLDRFEWKGGPFRSRQHIVNHIDMLFGLGDAEWSSDRDNRLAVRVMGESGDMQLSRMWDYDEVALNQERKWVQFRSLYASSWEQVYPMHGEEYFSPDDIEDEEFDWNSPLTQQAKGLFQAYKGRDAAIKAISTKIGILNRANRRLDQCRYQE